MSEPASPDSGPLSVDQAIAALLPAEEQVAPEAPVEAAAEPEEIEGEASAPEDAEDVAEQPAEAEETEAEAEPVVAAEPPKYWSQDAKAVFAAMTPEQQAVVLAQEEPREQITAKVKAEAAAATQKAQEEIGRVTQLAEYLSDFLPQAIETFKNRWGADPDWIAYANEHGAEAMMIAKVQHEQDLALLQQTAQATARAQVEAREATVKAEFATLATLAPDLVEPQKGPERRAEISNYLIAEGLSADDVKDISAKEMVLARKAMLWDQAQAKLKAGPPAKSASAPPAQRSPVRPAAAPVQSSQRSALQNAQARFNLNPSRENAEALLLAKG